MTNLSFFKLLVNQNYFNYNKIEISCCKKFFMVKLFIFTICLKGLLRILEL
ncbi:hypothetical protein [Wolbachia endosymbiont (group A) of Gymnosoma rotundatum]|uniref:hypothetical protein n=1 Tax=Wolbachia endosymbiont (group A) of Gymnosoma rotundatum TaxID=2954016 RepID=UPI002227C7C5|nr:hypothetical protein [Wolbachia endosymbiont (group A) of Gymnosoma rotundatum]